jgi:methyltransferase (TIGR00027 family)
MTEPLFLDVADTAAWIAAYRAIESQRSDALFRDPFADRLAGERGRLIAREVDGATNFAWMIAVRTRVIDDLVGKAIAEGADTVLNLGAGMDTRPYRLTLPAATRWIEVDNPRVVDAKNEQLAGEKPVCSLTRVGMDLADPARRRALLADVGGGSPNVLVIAEGVIGYLANEDVAALARDLSGQRAFRQWIVDYSSPMLRKAMRRRRRVRAQFRTAPFQFDPPDWERFFDAQGWRVTTMRYLGVDGESLGRPMPLPWAVRALSRIVPGQRETIRKMMAFVVLENAAARA